MQAASLALSSMHMVIEILLRAGANKLTTNLDGKNALKLAKDSGHEKAIKLLEDKKNIKFETVQNENLDSNQETEEDFSTDHTENFEDWGGESEDWGGE